MSVLTYTHIEIGSDFVKRVKVGEALGSKLSQALGHSVTLYVEGGFLCGLRVEEGTTYGPELITAPVIFGFCILLPSLFLLSFLIIPLPFFVIMLINLIQLIRANAAAKQIPCAILI